MKALRTVALLVSLGCTPPLLAAFIAFSDVGCTLPQIKSAYDIGVDLCHLFYGKHAELRASLTPQDICKDAEVLQPFVDHASTSEQQAGSRSSAALSRRRAAAIAPTP